MDDCGITGGYEPLIIVVTDDSGTVAETLGRERTLIGDPICFPFVHANNPGGPDAQVSAWVMLYRGFEGWVQVGWKQIKHADGTNGGRKNWNQRQYSNGTRFNSYEGNADTVGQLTRYEVRHYYDSGLGDYRFEVLIDSQHWIDYDMGWFPKSSAWKGEINGLGSQMPGETGNHLRFELVRWAGSDNVWHDANTVAEVKFNGGDDRIVPYLDHFDSDKINSETYTIWDKDC